MALDSRILPAIDVYLDLVQVTSLDLKSKYILSQYFSMSSPAARGEPSGVRKSGELGQ